MDTLKVGDRVRMSEYGKKYWGSGPLNPNDEEGVVVNVEVNYGVLPIQVKWDNGLSNSYYLEDLQKLEVASPFDELFDPDTVIIHESVGQESTLLDETHYNLFVYLTDSEKGELLLAQLEGKRIQFWDSCLMMWADFSAYARFSPYMKYRVYTEEMQKADEKEAAEKRIQDLRNSIKQLQEDW